MAMGVVCLRFKFRPTREMEEVLRKVKVMEQRAVNWLVANKKTSLNSVHHTLYFPLRQQFPDLHSHWVTSALKTATGIVHAFNKRKRKGQVKRPRLKKPFVTLSPHLFKVSFEGKWLKVTIFKSANDLEPIVRWFKPHHKYRRLLDRWKAGECTLGQITLTESSVSIPLKFPDPPTYQPSGDRRGCGPSCGLSRHYVAAINIARRGVEKFPSLSWLGQGFVGNPCCPSSGGMVMGFAVRHHDGKLRSLSTA